jgi:hypothetical protein
MLQGNGDGAIDCTDCALVVDSGAGVYAEGSAPTNLPALELAECCVVRTFCLSLNGNKALRAEAGRIDTRSSDSHVVCFAYIESRVPASTWHD